jgi:plasmid stability protein
LIILKSLIALQDGAMASITIRNLDDGLKGQLRLRAAEHGRSMEDEARHILRAALAEKTRAPADLFDAIRRRIAPLGGVDLDIPREKKMREPPRFEE